MLSFYVSGSPGFVFLNPLSLATDDCRSVLAVKGSLRRFAPWTAAGRSGRRGCLRAGSRRPPAQISECARLIRASSSIAGTGLMSVSPPATTRVYSRVAPRIVRIYTLRGFESPRLDHRALGQDRTVLRGVRERPDHRVCRTQASGRPWAEESLLPSDPRARPRLQDRVHPRLPEPAGASHADPTRAPQGRTATRGRDVAKRA